jgi:hypothetical protein
MYAVGTNGVGPPIFESFAHKNCPLEFPVLTFSLPSSIYNALSQQQYTKHHHSNIQIINMLASTNITHTKPKAEFWLTGATLTDAYTTLILSGWDLENLRRCFSFVILVQYMFVQQCAINAWPYVVKAWRVLWRGWFRTSDYY